MPDTCYPPKNVHDKGNDFRSQLQIVVEYLKDNTATASMVTDRTGVPQKNICRYKRSLERAGRIWEVARKPCGITGYRAWYLTTDPEKIPNHYMTQLKLF
jgi:hypothetical protein